MNQLAYSRLVNTSLSRQGHATQCDREHHHVLELIRAKDGDSAERVMREHVRARPTRSAGGPAHRRSPTPQDDGPVRLTGHGSATKGKMLFH
ncbi:FCD domain-containing protein [Streptomyces guryensis]|uniref:FCD domain-containing protein n=1 Tax=Streptomyces guryensis TaxID=2886947 RepID=UPI0022B7B28B|nr:FCD domain-containing protein [Streptomyces guryensis]